MQTELVTVARPIRASLSSAWYAVALLIVDVFLLVVGWCVVCLSAACELGARCADELAQTGNRLGVVSGLFAGERQDDDGVPVVVNARGARGGVDGFTQVGGQVIQPRFQGVLVAALDGATVSVFDAVAERVAFTTVVNVVDDTVGERHVPVCANGTRVVEVVALDLPGVVNEPRNLYLVLAAEEVQALSAAVVSGVENDGGVGDVIGVCLRE